MPTREALTFMWMLASTAITVCAVFGFFRLIAGSSC